MNDSAFKKSKKISRLIFDEDSQFEISNISLREKHANLIFIIQKIDLFRLLALGVKIDFVGHKVNKTGSFANTFSFI
jgi:hypothetical protein